MAERMVLYADAEGKYRWRLVDGNNRITGNSGESFVDKKGARRAALQVRPDLEVVDADAEEVDDALS